MKEKINYEDLNEELESRAFDLKIPSKYIRLSKKIEWHINPDIGLLEKEYTIKKIINRAIFLEEIYETADLKEINPKYIQKQVEIKFNPKKFQKYSGRENSHLAVDLPNLGKMGKKDLERIIKKAEQMQKKERKQKHKFFLIISMGISLLGLFFLSSNLTGNAIGNLIIQNSNIIGVILFIMGLIATFLLSKKR